MLATLLEKRLGHRCIPANFAKFLKTFFHRTPPVAASVFSEQLWIVDSSGSTCIVTFLTFSHLFLQRYVPAAEQEQDMVCVIHSHC